MEKSLSLLMVYFESGNPYLLAAIFNPCTKEVRFQVRILFAITIPSKFAFRLHRAIELGNEVAEL